MTREEAIEILNEQAYFFYEDTYPYERIAYDMAIKSLSADKVEVVRCKDCIHRQDRRFDLGLFICEMFYGQGDVSDENFCQWGERREE